MGYRSGVFLLALAMGLCGAGRVAADEAEDRAVAAVEKLGGHVTRDEAKPGRPVVAVSFTGGFGLSEATDLHLKELAPFKELATLDLSNTKVTNAGLRELAQFTKLTSLSLLSTKVTDAGLKELILHAARSETFSNFWNSRVMSDSIAFAWVVGTPSRTSWTAAWKSANFG